MLLLTMAAGLMLLPRVTVDGRVVLVGDLVRTAAGRRLGGPVARLAALRLPARGGSVVLSAESVRSLIRRRAPALMVDGSGPVTIAARRPLPVRGPGDDAPAERLPSGSRLVLRAAAGPVTIERSVTTLQPGRPGRRVFVRDGEGHVLAAPLALAEAAR